MVSKTNTPLDWRLLAEDDIYLILAHTKIIRDFLQKEVPELFNDEEAKTNP